MEFLLSKKPVFAEGQEACCVSDADLKKYLMAAELYEKVLACIDREPIAVIISKIWFGSGYRYLILSDSSMHGYLEYYDYLHGLAETFDSRNQSMADFLDHIRENLGDYKKIDELKVLGYAAGGVRIMPVHQSKGLEFPVVIVANSGNKGVNDRGGSTPAYISPLVGLTFNLVSDEGGALGSARRCNYFYRMGKDENKAREEAELRRLLYVALTRAENHLVISGCHGHSNRSGEGSMLNMFLSAFGWMKDVDPFACADLEPYIELIDNIRWTSKTTGRNLADVSSVSQRYQCAEAPEYPLLKNEYSATAINSEIREAENSESEGRLTEGTVPLPELKPEIETILSSAGLEAEFGTLCHRIIEWMIKSGDPESCPTVDDVSDVMRPFNKSLNENQLPLIMEEGIGLATVFFNSEIWKSIDDKLIESELPFTALGRHDGRDVYVNGVIDIVYETDDFAGIIDFKTDRRIIPGEYDNQMKIYIDAVSEILAKPVSCSLYYLRGGVEVKVKEVM